MTSPMPSLRIVVCSRTLVSKDPELTVGSKSVPADFFLEPLATTPTCGNPYQTVKPNPQLVTLLFFVGLWTAQVSIFGC